MQRVERNDDGNFAVHADAIEDPSLPDAFEPEYQLAGRETFTVPTRPVLATGFQSNLGPVVDHFDSEDGTVALTDRDESTRTSGLFLSDPAVEHGGQQFCFIYKFRSRFPVIAGTIGNRLGADTDALSIYKDSEMFLEDLSCCEPVDCTC